MGRVFALRTSAITSRRLFRETEDQITMALELCRQASNIAARAGRPWMLIVNRGAVPVLPAAEWLGHAVIYRFRNHERSRGRRTNSEGSNKETPARLIWPHRNVNAYTMPTHP